MIPAETLAVDASARSRKQRGEIGSVSSVVIGSANLCYRLADYIESEPARKQAQKEAQKAKLDALEKKLGISKDGNGELPPRKHRLDDTEYLEESKEIVDNVKSAVMAGMSALTVSFSRVL